MIDTLKLSKGLKIAGMTPDQAEKVAEAINESQTDSLTDYVTKKDLDLGLEKVVDRITTRFVGILVAQTILIFSAVYFMIGHPK